MKVLPIGLVEFTPKEKGRQLAKTIGGNGVEIVKKML